MQGYIRDDGWAKHNIWEHSAVVRDLYAKRCRLEAEEMTCAAQAAELLKPLVSPGDTLLDVGCGSGWFYHSLKKRDISVEYFGIDASPTLVNLGREIMPEHGLPADRLQVIRLDDLDCRVDHVLCMNVLSNIDNYHRSLERLLKGAAKSVILRESCTDQEQYSYVKDHYLDPGVDLKVHVNAYKLDEVLSFIRSYGFSVRPVVDERTGGAPEKVIDHNHYWTFIVATREEAPCPA